MFRPSLGSFALVAGLAAMPFSASCLKEERGRTIAYDMNAFPRETLEAYRDEEGRTIFEVLNVPEEQLENPE